MTVICIATIGMMTLLFVQRGLIGWNMARLIKSGAFSAKQSLTEMTKFSLFRSPGSINLRFW